MMSQFHYVVRVAVAAALLTFTALPAAAVGQVVIFRDAQLREQYQEQAQYLTALQLQEAIKQDTAIRRANPLVCQGVIKEVYAPQNGQLDPEACRVVVTLRHVSGFHPLELPSVSYWVQRPRAMTLHRGSRVTLKARLYALEANGAVAIELEAPIGWLDVRESEAGGVR